MSAFQKLRNKVIIKLQSVDTKSMELPIIIKDLLLIQYSILMLSYIEEKSTNSFLYLFTLIARPQILMNTTYMEFVTLPIIFLYLLSVFVGTFPGRQKILLIGQLLRLSLYNAFFEVSTGYLKQVVRLLLLIISSVDVLFIQETLNIESINFSLIKTNYFSFILHILNNLILIFKFSIPIEEAIPIVCLLFSVFAALNQIIFCPIKCTYLHPIIMYFHTMTMYQTILIHTNLSLPDFPNLIFSTLLYKIIVRFTKLQSYYPVKNFDYLLLRIGKGQITQDHLRFIREKKFHKKEEDRIIIATIKIKQKRHYEGLCLLNQHKSRSWLLTLKKQQIQDQCLSKLEYKIKNSSKFDQSIALAVEQLMKSEDQNFIIQQQIIELIKLKVSIQRKLIEKDLQIFKQIYVFINQIQQMSVILEKQFAQFPNQKTLAILCFLQAEILNDYISASTLSLQTTKQERLKNQTNQAIYNMFNSKMIYLITDFDSQKLIINRMSSNATSILNLGHDQLVNKAVDQLLPDGIREHHDEMIISFLEEGISKYMRKVDIKYYISHPQKQLIAADFTLDISFAQSSLKFVTFLQPLVHQPMTIVLNSNKIITEASEHLIETLNEKIENILYRHISVYLPSIENITYSQILENVEIISQQSSQNTSKSYSIITTVSVKIKELHGQILYYLLTFQYIKKLSQNSFNQTGYSFSNGPLSCENKTEGRTEIKIEEERLSDIYKENINIFKPYIMDDQNQKHQQHSTFFQFQQFSNNYLKITQDRPPKRSTSGGQRDNSQNTRSQNNSTLIISPNNSYINDHLLTQQQFYMQNSKKQLSFVKEECSIDMAREKLEVQDEESLEEQGGKGQDISAPFNARQSPFYKKFKIMSNVNRQTCSSKTCRLLKFAQLSLISQLAIIFIIYDSLNSSLSQLVNDIQFLQIKNQAFYPLESFWVNRFIIFNYMKMKSSNQLTESEYQQLIVFPEEAIPIQFKRLLFHFENIMNQLELQSFLTVVYLNVTMYTDSNIGEVYNLSLRSCFNILMEFQYTLEQFYVNDQIPNTDSPYMYYSYKNFHNMKQEFSLLNDRVYDQAIQHSQIILFQQRILYLVQIILFGISVILLLILQKLNENYQKKYLVLLTQPSRYSYESEIHNYQMMIKFIETDSDNLFKYQFSVIDKEKKLIQNQFNQAKYTSNKQSKKMIEKLPFNVSDIKVKLMVFMLAILIACQATYVYFMMTSYMLSYEPTAAFYRSLSDIGTDIPTLYSHSSVLYGISNFLFLNDFDKQQFFDEINNAIVRLQSFVTNDIQIGNHRILSSEFMSKYNQLTKANLCNYIHEEVFTNIQSICSESLDGNLERGISSSLVYILNKMITERDFNQFTEKIGYQKYELEGALIFSEFLEDLNTDFYKDLKNVTVQELNALIYTVVVLIIILIIVMIFIASVGRSYLNKKIDISIKSISLIPFEVICFDNYHELQIKSLQNQDTQKLQL